MSIPTYLPLIDQDDTRWYVTIAPSGQYVLDDAPPSGGTAALPVTVQWLEWPSPEGGPTWKIYPVPTRQLAAALFGLELRDLEEEPHNGTQS